MHVYTGTKLTTSEDFSGLQKQYYWYFYFYTFSLAVVSVMTLPNFTRIYFVMVLAETKRDTSARIRIDRHRDNAQADGHCKRCRCTITTIHVTSDCFYHAQNFVF